MKKQIFQIIQPDRGDSLASRVFDWFITTLILMSVVSVYVVTFDLSPQVKATMARFEDFLAIVFSIEYVLRIWTADLLHPKCGVFGSRVKYVCSLMALVDLVAVLPFWLPMFVPASLLGVRALRLIRVLRLLKLGRYFEAVASIGDVIRKKRRELMGSLFFVFLMMMVSSLVIYSAEHGAQPEVFRNAFSGLWWAVATLTTVGYGDIYPVTVLGRIFGALIALSGVAAVAIPSGVITTGLIESLQISQEDDTKTIRCPHCGKRIKLEEK